MQIRWRLLTRAQKWWAAVTLLLWTTAISLIVWMEIDGDQSVTRREIIAFTAALVLSSCSTVCLKIENSQRRLDKAFMLGYQCRTMEENGCRVASQLVPLPSPEVTVTISSELPCADSA